MRIPRYWARDEIEAAGRDGQPTTFDAWGWSCESAGAAKAKARERARRLAELVTSGREPGPYGYFDRPIREEIKETLACRGEEHGLITRNGYGSLVLNSSRVMFVDVDFPTVKPRGLIETLRFAFSASYREARQRAAEQPAWDRIRRWAEANPQRGFRLYRTRRGMRLLMTDRLYEPAASETTVLLETLGADPLYVKLTQAQECFRARLTPKPYRCGLPSPRPRFPFYSAEAESKFRQWEAEYAQRAKGFRACELVGEFGVRSNDEIVEQTQRMHDEQACLPEGAPLA